MIISNRQIHLKEYPNAWNPSLTYYKEGFLLTFRHTPDPSQGWVSYIGIVLLDKSLKPISVPQILDTRKNNLIPSHSEDARVFWIQDKLYLLFNDNCDDLFPSNLQRRDMFIAELLLENGVFKVSEPLKLVHPEKYETVLWQKNWVPFVWNNKLLLGYQIAPHEVLEPDFSNGNCRIVDRTPTPTRWKWGQLRGGTPGQLLDGEYLAFFHSSSSFLSEASKGNPTLHYVMGAYTFSALPPFEVTKMSHMPITAKEFYSENDAGKKVIFPGGYVLDESKIHLAYGRYDREIWIVTLDTELLKSSLVPLRRSK